MERKKTALKIREGRSSQKLINNKFRLLKVNIYCVIFHQNLESGFKCSH